MFSHPRLKAALRLGSPVFATNDANYMRQPQNMEQDWDDEWVVNEQTRVLLPYLSDDALAQDTSGSALRRMADREGIMFHGAMARGVEGTGGFVRDVRVQMAAMLNHLNPSSTPANLRTESHADTNAIDPWGNQVPEQVAETAKAMQAARICMAPEGDTPMSRRLIDALAAGCVPLFYVVRRRHSNERDPAMRTN